MLRRPAFPGYDLASPTGRAASIFKQPNNFRRTCRGRDSAGYRVDLGQAGTGKFLERGLDRGNQTMTGERYDAAMASISIMKSGPYSFDTSTSVTAGAAGGATEAKNRFRASR